MTDRPKLVPMSLRVAENQGAWLDAKARQMGRSTGEVVRAIIDEAMRRERAGTP